MTGALPRTGAVVVAALLLTGCGGGADVGTPAAPSTPPSPAAGPGTLPGTAPVPGATLAPDPAATDAAVPEGLTLAVALPADPDPADVALVDAVDRWAGGRGVAVTRHPVGADAHLADVADAVAPLGDRGVVVVAGPALVDLLDSVSSQRLGTPFLVLGAQLPEPTANVTATVWAGATSRGSRAPADNAPTDAGVAATPADAAVAAGMAQVLSGVTGVVVHLDG